MLENVNFSENFVKSTKQLVTCLTKKMIYYNVI